MCIAKTRTSGLPEKHSRTLKIVGSNRLPQEFLAISTDLSDKKSVVEVKLQKHACGRAWLHALLTGVQGGQLHAARES